MSESKFNPTLSYSHVPIDVVLKVAQRFGIHPSVVEEMFEPISSKDKHVIRELMAKLDLSAKEVIDTYRDLYGR